MRARLFALAAIATFCAGEAVAAPFCVVSGTGRQCWYFTLSSCQDAARRVDGGCVANTEQAPPTYVPAPSYTPPPAQYTPPQGTRPYADVAGAFQRGVDASRQRQYEEERRAVELERMRLENERLTMTTPPPDKPEDVRDTWSIVAEQVAREGFFLRPRPGEYDEARVQQCEHLRFTANAAYARPNRDWEGEIWPAANEWRACLRSPLEGQR